MRARPHIGATLTALRFGQWRRGLSPGDAGQRRRYRAAIAFEAGADPNATAEFYGGPASTLGLLVSSVHPHNAGPCRRNWPTSCSTPALTVDDALQTALVFRLRRHRRRSGAAIAIDRQSARRRGPWPPRHLRCSAARRSPPTTGTRPWSWRPCMAGYLSSNVWSRLAKTLIAINPDPFSRPFDAAASGGVEGSRSHGALVDRARGAVGYRLRHPPWRDCAGMGPT